MLRIGLMMGFFSLAAGLCFASEAVDLNKLRCADLPPLLQFADGRPVLTREDWAARAAEIRELMCRYFIGTFPGTVPAITQARIVSQRQVNGSMRRMVELTFDTPHKVSCSVEIWIPNGAGPHPVLLVQPNSDQLKWAGIACARGYIVCLYPGLDSHNPEPDYPGFESTWEAFRAEYPNATWTEISTKAWLASRALDYILNPISGYSIAKRQVAIIGHSRYGKQALIAAAFDPRITSTVAVSPGSPGSCAYRFTSRDTFMETPADFPGEWFLHDLKSYAGREDELPIDAHGWFALIAPRKCMMDAAYNDQCEPTFAVERTYTEAKNVYRLLGHEDNLRLNYRAGGHYPLTDARRAEDLDWFDVSFGRAPAAPITPELFIHNFDWDKWKAVQSGKELEPPTVDSDKRTRILWSLGEAPAKRENWKKCPFFTDEESRLLLHDRKAVKDTVRVPVCFGDGVRGNAYFDPKRKGSMPVVIWLHPYSYPMGYIEVYGAQGTTVCHRLAEQGFLVIAYDQSGFGSRILESSKFYDKYPKWSRLGRMVRDVSAAVDFMVDGEGKSKGSIPSAKKDGIYILGYSLGGMVGLYAASLDERIAGVASFCGFTPLRTDTDKKPTGGIRRLWQWHALQPRLGLYQGKEKEIPFDYDDILSLISPRPCLIVSPKRDRMSDWADVSACVEAVGKSWSAKGAEANFTYLAPDDCNRFQADQQAAFIDWVTKIAHPAQ